VPPVKERRWTLFAILGATFMLLVDVTIIQVALPRIQRELHASFTNLAWVIDAYALTLAALILTSGTLADRFGRRRIFVWGVGVFTAASALCGVAQTALQLDVARGLQGIGGAAMFATSLALIGQEFSGRDRGNAIALWGATIGGAVAIGPLLGGILTEWLTWRWIFYVNLPIGIAVIVLAQRHIANRTDPEARTADPAGLVTFSSALALLVFSLLRGNDLGWSSGVILGTLAGAAILFVLFVVLELRQARPMLDLALFRRPAFCGVSLGTFAIGAGMFAMFPWISLYLQNGLGYSPLQGGLRMLPATLLAFVVPILARRFGSRWHASVHLWVGLGVVSIGLLLMRDLGATSHWTALLPGLIVVGFGIGLANPAIGQLALAVAPPERAGMASGISNTCRIGGLAMGFAALGALLQDRLWVRLHELAPRASHALVNAIASAGPKAAAAPAPAAQQAGLVAAGRAASVAGLDADFLAGACLLALGCVLVLALVRVPRPEPAPAAEAVSPPVAP
jgi:EmrB/QacA subfamily drug resistance transporter